MKTEIISLVEKEKINTKIQMIMRHTDYSEDKAKNKLSEFNFDETLVVKDYFGITEKKKLEKLFSEKPVTSINQEIYKHIRCHLDSAMNNYRERVDESKKVL